MESFYAGNACPECDRIGAGFQRHGTDCVRFGSLGEHMHRQCGDCGHEWAEEARGLRSTGTTRVGVPKDNEHSRWRALVYHVTGALAPPRVRRTARS